MSKDDKPVQFGPRIEREAGNRIQEYCDDNLITPNAFTKFIIEKVAYLLPRSKK